MSGVVVMQGESPVKLNPEGPKAKAYAEARAKGEANAYISQVMGDLYKRAQTRKSNPDLAGAEDTLNRAYRKGKAAELFTSGYIDGVYALYDSVGGQRRRKTRKTRSRRNLRKTR